MKKSPKSVIQFIVLLGIGLVLVWLSFKQVEPQKDNILKAFQDADYFWVAISMVIAFFSHVLRAYRWNILLKPLHHRVGFVNANCHVLVGYLVNYGIPRMGEISRCTLAAKYDNVPFQVALGTVITERIVDFILFLLIFCLTLFLEFSNLIGLANELIFNKISDKFSGLAQNPTKLWLVIGSVLLVVFLFLFFRKKIAALLKGKLGGIVKGLGDGIGSIRNMEKPLMFILLSISIWACYFYSMYVCFFAIPGTSHLSQSAALTLLLFGTFGVIFSPGGLGAFPLIISGILINTYHIDDISSFAFPWLVWSSQFLLIVILALISLIVLPIINKKVNVVS